MDRCEGAVVVKGTVPHPARTVPTMDRVACGLPTMMELAEVAVADHREFERVLADIERVRRRCETLLAAGSAYADAGGIWRSDGHRTVRAWQRATLDHASDTALRIRRNGAALAALPALADACERGAIGVDVLDLFGRLWANPRVRTQMRTDIDLLIDVAITNWFDDTTRLLRRWEALADADGAARSAADAHHARRARVSLVGDEGVLVADGGITDMVFLREVLARFTDAEFHADLDDARERTGGPVAATDLARTHRQRCFDAVVNIFTTAATGAPAVIGTEPLVNIKVDQSTAGHLLRRAAGEDPPALSASEFRDRVCETVDGTPRPHHVALSALLVGRLRSYLTDPKGVVTHLGRRSRLFRRGARDAAMLHDLRCLWPGCDMPIHRCQIDHTIPWANAGPTNPTNAGGGCSTHNLTKNRGYRTVRRPDSSWDIYRPDGTRIGEHIHPAA
jgi:hypothetical protein